MATFPTLSSGSLHVSASLAAEPMAMHPLVQTKAFITRVITFIDDSEQRWTVSDSLVSLDLSYRGVNGYDTSILRKFFTSQKGRYVSSDLLSTFSITVFGVLYNYCTFDQDDFVTTANRSETHDFSLKITQVRRN